jgi:glycosyltransferase involved in cell wall biosynthesis
MGLRDGGPRLGRVIERRRYRTADLVIAVSDATRDDACELLGVPGQKVVRVYNGIDLDRWSVTKPDESDILQQRGISERRFTLYVGGPDWHKNIEGMMGGLAHARRMGIDLDLLWAGHLTSEHRRRVGALAREAGVAHAIRLLGYVGDDDLRVLYRRAVAHLLVSRCEGFGLTVVEAMAAGCPVITTARGSLAEVAADAALTVDPENHAAIGASLVRLCRESILRNRLIERGRERATAFSRAAQATSMVHVYRNFLGA